MESQQKYTAGNFVRVFVLLAHDFITFGEQQNRDSSFVRVSFVVKHCEPDSSYDVPSTRVCPSDKDG